MKKILLMLMIISSLLISCEKEKTTDTDKNPDTGITPEEPEFELDPNAMMAISYAAVATRNENHLSAEEIVTQASKICHYNTDLGEHYRARAFADNQRDLVNNRLLLLSVDVFDSRWDDIRLNPDFLQGWDVVIVRNFPNTVKIMDTIAYVPNAVHRKAETDIYAAFEAKEYEKCMQLFDDAFIFVPITGAEWRALREQGLN